MSSSTLTAVGHFGDNIGSVTGLIIVELDEAMHLDAEGKTITRFGPEDQVFFIIHTDAKITIKRVTVTDLACRPADLGLSCPVPVQGEL